MIKRFAECLKEARVRARLSQRALSEQVGIADSYISRMETGAFPPPSRDVTVKLADALGMSGGPLTLYVATKAKAALERFIFFLAASVAGADDVQGINLVEVENDKLGQAFTQATSVQQSTAAAGAVSQQMLTQLQALTAQVAHQTAKIEELQQQITPASSQVSHLDIEEDEETRKVKGVIRAVGEGNVVAALRKFVTHPRYMLHQNWRQGEDAEEWEDTITAMEKKEGSLYLLMKGFQVITVPQEQYWDQLKYIHALGDWRVKIIDSAIKHNMNRLEYFKNQVTTGRCEFRHIMPKGALDWYLNERFHSPEAWAYLWREEGGTKAEYWQIALHLREVIKYLKIYDNYKIGLLEMDDCPPGVEVELYKKVHWEVKVGHAVLLENFLLGQEQDIQIRNEEVVKAFANFYENLWNDRRYVNTDKNYVIRKLDEYALKADELSHASTLKAV